MFLNIVCFKFYIDLYLHIRYIYRLNRSSDLLKIDVSGLIMLSIITVWLGKAHTRVRVMIL